MAQSAFEPAPTLIRKYGKGGRLELSVGFFQRLFEAGLDQPIKETPILQVLRSSDKKRDQFSLRAKLSDGIFDYTACFFDKKLTVQNDRDKFAEKVQKVGNTWIGGEIIAVTAGRWCSEVMLADQKYAFIVESYDLLARNLPELMPEGMTETKHHDGNPESFKGFKPQSSIGIPWGGSESGDMGEPAAKRAKPLTEQTNRIVPPMSTSVSGGGPLAGLASVTPIKSLSPYLQRWKIHGLVTNREELRAIKSKAGKDLRIFSFEIADKNGDKIRITGFDAEADKASTQIQQGQTYFIANGAVKTANKQWNYTGCDYEITLNRTSEITPSYDDKIEKPAFRLRICPLKDIPAHNGETVDVLVIVTEVGEVQNFTSRNNKELTKRDLTVVDKSGTETQVTLWGDIAKGFDPEAKGQVVGFKGYLVREFGGGYSLSSGFSSSEYVLTPSLPEVAELYEWKDGEMGTTTFQKITATGGSNLLTNQRPLRLMQSLRLGDNASGAAEYVTIHADIVRIKPENSLYKACPSPECKKKVVDVDGSYRCEKCGHTTQDFKWLYLLQSEISDGTASVYATIFSPVADQIIGKSADELGNIMEADHSEFMQILSDAYLKPYTFRIKAKSEFYNDENRMKYVVMKAANRDYAAYNQLLLSTIAKLDAIIV